MFIRTTPTVFSDHSHGLYADSHVNFTTKEEKNKFHIYLYLY
jgi:hypothetical protein